MRLPFPERNVAEALVSAERQIRLIDRVAPLNLLSERERLLAALARGKRVEPRLRYAPPPDLGQLRDGLSRLCRELSSHGWLGDLYAARALELEREAALVEAIGRREFRSLALSRFHPEAEGAEARVRGLVAEWLAEPISAPEGELVVSDDQRHPLSLVNLLRARIGASGLPIRVELRESLPTIAAAGHDIVLVRPRVALSVARASRITLHELEGHVFPRVASAAEPIGLFRAGSSGAAEHEEGRALLLEERAGLLDPERRRELALRHAAARAVRDGASFLDTLSVLTGHGSAPATALDVALRAARGGGLAREVVYLPAYVSVKAAFAEEPGLERLFERGRVSLAAARTLAAHEQRRLARAVDDNGVTAEAI